MQITTKFLELHKVKIQVFWIQNAIHKQHKPTHLQTFARIQVQPSFLLKHKFT
jgi:hypothetical protein